MPKIVDKEEERTRIMDAAMRLYVRVGYQTATISSIAREAGIGKGTFYLYFDSKEQLTASIADRIFRATEASFTGFPPPDSLDEFAEQLMRTMRIDAERARSLRVFFEVFGPGFASEEFVQRVSDFFDGLGEFYAGHLARLQQHGQVNPELDPHLTGRSLAAMIDGIILHRGLFSIPHKRHALMIEQAVKTIVGGLMPRS